MPDFERLIRKIELDLSDNPNIVRARHAGEDRTRMQIALFVMFVFLLILVLSL